MRQSILLLSFFLAQSVQSQTLPYVFSVEQGVYAPLTNATSVNNGLVWDDFEFQVTLGFSFQLFGQSTTTMKLYGEFALNIFGLPAASTPMLISYGADLIDRGFDTGISQSPISYKVEGSPGSRIFKMQWANAGFYDDPSGASFTNTQMWLFEGSNNVELHFGLTQVNNSEVFFDFTGPIIGFMDTYSLANETFNNLWYLAGPVNNPVVKNFSYNNTDTLVQTLNGAPGNGLIYRFAAGLVDINDPQQVSSQVRVYPSIVSTGCTVEVAAELALNEKDMRFKIIDQFGREVRSEPLAGTLTQVDMSGLSNGLYYINLFSPNRVIATKKIIKQ